MTTFIGDPIFCNPTDTPEELRDRVKKALEDLISQHQRIPGSICLALFERFHKRHTSQIFVSSPLDLDEELKCAFLT